MLWMEVGERTLALLADPSGSPNSVDDHSISHAATVRPALGLMGIGLTSVAW